MTTANSMTIGQVASISGTPATTLRYYERRGLIDPPARVGGQRRYGPAVLERLMMIKFCRIAGLSLDDIERVLADRSSGRADTKAMARRQIELLERQTAELDLARRMMLSVIECDCADVEVCTCGAMDPIVAELRHRLG
jgi:MerR family transcriptional regulator, redox-sensitive transcriptional activator SoxR